MPFLDSGARFISDKVLDWVLYIACIIELPEDGTSLNSNTPNKITKSD